MSKKKLAWIITAVLIPGGIIVLGMYFIYDTIRDSRRKKGLDTALNS